MSWLYAGIASAEITLAGVKWISGNNKEKKAKRAREALQAPKYDIQNEYFQNANSANQMAQGGLPSASKDFYTNQVNKGLSAGANAILASGGNPNDISKLFSSYDEGVGKIASADAETHLNNIKYYMGVNKDLASQKTIQWAINKQQPYLNTLKELSAAQKAGEATKWEAASDTMSALSSFGTSVAGNGGLKSSGKKSGGNDLSGVSSNFNTQNSVNNRTAPTEYSTINGRTSPNVDPFGYDTPNANGGSADYQDYLDWKEGRR